MADARVVANRFLELARADEERSLTPMQVLKLVYIAHGWNLALHDSPLIDQAVEAWQYGPVIPDLYRAMRGTGSGAVRGPLPAAYGANAEDLTASEMHLVDQIYNLYGRMNGIALSRITHAKNTPWRQVYKPDQHGVEIPTDLIAEHYQRLSRERAT